MKLKLAGFLGVVFAVLLHAGVLLFGGILFPKATADHATLQEVDLLSDEDIAEKKPDEKIEEEPEEIKTEPEDVPNPDEIIKSLETPVTNEAPELAAMSISAIEALLNNQLGAGGDFSMSGNFNRDGVLNGKGAPGSVGSAMDGAFNMNEIDQKPRPVFQSAPSFPSEMRGKKFEGVVTLIFIVDASGKVTDPRVQKSNHTAFEKPALDAIRKWKYEPGIRGGKRVACHSRVDIRFPAN